MLRSTLFALLLAMPWTSRAQPPDNFSFLTGSCAFLHPNDGDTSYYLYRGDTSIYYSMSRTPADFMLWLGDNWYLGKEEWDSYEGLKFKARYTRTAKPMQPMVQRQWPEYATWDDHDYGPDQSQSDYPLKKESRQVFMDTWKDNPSYGENGEGIYTSFRREDVRFLLLDDRWFRASDKLWDYKFFLRPNPAKRMLGHQQMAWLKKQLLRDTTASFKIIVCGSQVLNPWSREDGLVHFPLEYKELLGFIADNRIAGVLFLTGDRHFSEIIRVTRKDHYPLYDVTVSPLTSTPARPGGYEKRNKYRLPGSLITTNNFARVSVSGPVKDRVLKFEFFDKNRKLLFQWTVSSLELRDHRRRN